MTKLIGIYAIKNVTCDKYYIGASIDIARRFSQHRSKLNANTHASSKLQNAWNKYGSTEFVFEILHFCDTSSELVALEEFYISKYNSILAGYNTNPPGVIKIPAKYPRKPHSQETKDKIAASHKGKPKPPLTESHKQKLREVSLSRVFTDEQKAEISRKISAATKGKRGIPWTEETRKKVLSKRVGSKRSDIAKQNMSIAAKKAWEIRKLKSGDFDETYDDILSDNAISHE